MHWSDGRKSKLFILVYSTDDEHWKQWAMSMHKYHLIKMFYIYRNDESMCVWSWTIARAYFPFKCHKNELRLWLQSPSILTLYLNFQLGPTNMRWRWIICCAFARINTFAWLHARHNYSLVIATACERQTNRTKNSKIILPQAIIE